jgi:hypothetical protein
VNVQIIEIESKNCIAVLPYSATRGEEYTTIFFKRDLIMEIANSMPSNDSHLVKDKGKQNKYSSPYSEEGFCSCLTITALSNNHLSHLFYSEKHV